MGRIIFGVYFLLLTSSLSAKVQLAYCVDISGSANGVINELNQSVWTLASRFSSSDEILEMALVGYGRESCNQYRGNVEVLSGFNASVFDIGHKLMRKANNTAGGTHANHYEALKVAIKKLKWDTSLETKKQLIAIVNGDVQYQKMKKIKEWLDKQSITLSIIYFDGEIGRSFSQKWIALSKEIKVDGYVVKNEVQKVKYKLNFDAKYLNEMRNDFLSTLMPFGGEGRRFSLDLKYVLESAEQTSDLLSGQILEYLLSKEFQVYLSNYDLVAAYMLNPEKVLNMKNEDFPNLLKGFSEDQLKKYLEIKVNQRKLLMKKIRVESDRRTDFMVKQILKSQNYSAQHIYEIILVEVNKSYPIITASLN